MFNRFHTAAIAIAIAGAALTACSGDSVAGPTGSPLSGLKETSTHDSSSGTPANTSPGYFHGTVMGQSAPGSGNDSLATAPRIAGVKVTIYQQVRTAAGVEAGTEMGSVVTGADGLFTLPTLAAGDYVVTFVPPAGSPYHGVFAFGYLNGNSATYPWWVVLSKS